MMLRKLKELLRSQVVMLYVSTLLGVVLGFVASIVNTQALGPIDYGDVRYVQNIIQLIASLLLFGYFLSGSRLLALSDDNRYRAQVRGLMVLILMACSLMLFISIAIVGGLHMNQPQIRSLFFLSIPVCLYPLLVNYVNTTAQGDNHIGLLSCARLLPALIYIPVAWFIYHQWEATSMMMILLQWGIYSIVLMIILGLTRPSFRNVKAVWPRMQAENKSYGILLYYGSLAMVVTNYLAGVTLGIFNDDNSQVGFYTLALNLAMPLAYLPGIVGTAFFRKFSRQPRIPSRVMRLTLLMTLLTCLGFIALINVLVSILYPADYQIVGSYASYMSVGFAIHGIGDMLNRFLGSHGQGKAILWSSVACGAVKVTGFIFLVYWFNINGALVTTIVSSITYALVIGYYYKRFTS